MKSYELKRKSINQLPSNSHKIKYTDSASPPKNTTTLTMWEKAVINSSQTINIDSGIFHYEIVVRGEEFHKSVGSEKRYQSVSKIKVCVKSFEYNGIVYDIFINPIDCTSTCRQDKTIVINWKQAIFTQPVLTKPEMNKEEQFNLHMNKLENAVREIFIPEILAVFNRNT